MVNENNHRSVSVGKTVTRIPPDNVIRHFRLKERSSYQNTSVVPAL